MVVHCVASMSQESCKLYLQASQNHARSKVSPFYIRRDWSSEIMNDSLVPLGKKCQSPHLSDSKVYPLKHYCVVVRWLSRVWLFATPCTAECQASLSFSMSQSLLKLMSIELVMPSNHLVLCGHLLLLRSVFPSIRVCLLNSKCLNLPLWFPWAEVPLL